MLNVVNVALIQLKRGRSMNCGQEKAEQTAMGGKGKITHAPSLGSEVKESSTVHQNKSTDL